MPKIAVLAKLTAQPGKRDDLVKAFQGVVENAQNEPGTLAYALHLSQSEPDVIWFYEFYADADALQAHSRSEAMRAAGPLFGGLLAGRAEITRLDPVAGKGLPI